jgi:CRP-like cAMP-binding protein
MFFVFEGEVNIYKKKTDNDKKNMKKNNINTNEKFNKEIEYVLSKGDEYGKEDIKKEKREVEVESKTRCILGFLSIQDWILIFEKTKILEKNDINNFISKINIFKEINEVLLNNLCDLIKIKKVSKGEFLVKKNEQYNNIYIIRYGSFQLFFNSKIRLITEYDLNSFSSKKNRVESAKYKFENNCVENLNYQIITLFQGEIIGDIEYYLHKEKYILYAKCTSDDAQVFEISKNSFDSICNKRIKYIIVKEIRNKINYYMKRCNEIRKVNKNKSFGLKNKYKLMIIKSLEEENKDIFEKMENKIKNKSQNNNKKLNLISFYKDNNIHLADTSKMNFVKPFFLERINKIKQKNLYQNNSSFNTLKINSSYNNSKKAQFNNISNNIVYLKNKANKSIFRKALSNRKYLKEKIIMKLLNKKMNDLSINKKRKINKNLLRNNNKTIENIYSSKAGKNLYNFNYPSKSSFIKNNSSIKKNTICSY